MAASPAWHLMTCEYPPRIGGVADFTCAVAGGLAARGADVHVWSPAPAAEDPAIRVHELTDGYSWSALGGLDRALDACPCPRRVFVQWVPHGYGYKSLNVPFCRWVRRRALSGDEVHLMVHEPFLAFDPSKLRQNVGALVHRLMLRILIASARKVWVSTTSFLPEVHRFGADPSITAWLPVPSSIPRIDDSDDVAALRMHLAGTSPVVGYFGTCNSLVSPMLRDVLRRIAVARPDVRFVLIGRGTEPFARALIETGELDPDTIAAYGERSAREVSLLLQCADVFVQPYHDGVSTRRTTLMALLEHGRAVVSAAGVRTEPDWPQTEALAIASPGDPQGLAAIAVELLQHPTRRAVLGDRARALYGARFDVTRTLDALSGAPAAPLVAAG